MIVSVINNKATIFNIQSFSLNDGDGIRTTIFFKGCPLDCVWCHNPESNSKKTQLMFHSKLCIGCELCAKACKNGVHSFINYEGQKVHIVDEKKCICCGECLKVCCYGALSLIGEKMSVNQVYNILKSDLSYFNLNNKKGGITFSGGEPMLYTSFIKELVTKLNGVNIAMETCGYALTKDYEEILPYIDTFLFDYKVTDSSEHKRLCNVDNKLILKNLDFLYKKGKNIVIRLPLIPGLNDTDNHFDGISNLLKKYPKIKKAEIMPYNTFGISKAKELGDEISPLIPKKAASDLFIESCIKKLHNRGCVNVYLS